MEFGTPRFGYFAEDSNKIFSMQCEESAKSKLHSDVHNVKETWEVGKGKFLVWNKGEEVEGKRIFEADEGS